MHIKKANRKKIHLTLSLNKPINFKQALLNREVTKSNKFPS